MESGQGTISCGETEIWWSMVEINNSKKNHIQTVLCPYCDIIRFHKKLLHQY